MIFHISRKIANNIHSIEFILIYFLNQNFKLSKVKKDILLYDCIIIIKY